jgi:hypothetical protein
MIKKALVMTDSCLVFNAKIDPDGNPTPVARISQPGAFAYAPALRRKAPRQPEINYIE